MVRTRVLPAVAVLVAAVGGCAAGGGPANRPDAPAASPAGGTKPLHAPANFDPSLAGYVACSSLIVAGTVVRVTDGGPGRMRTTLRVSRWVKPATGPARVTVETPDIAAQGGYRRWPAGTALRLVVDVDPAALPSWQFSRSEFARLAAAAPDAAGLDCPYGPS